MATAALRRRTRDDIVRLAHRGLAVEGFTRAATGALARAVQFDGSCVLTLDPATLLPTAEVVENALAPAARRRMAEIEVAEPDVNKFADLAAAPRPAASLSGATGGDLDRSLRQRELRRPGGFEDELRAVLPSPTGTWGALTLLREARTAHFTPADVQFVASVAEALGDGLRRATLLAAVSAAADDDDGDEGAGERPDAPGLVILAPDDTVEMADEPAHRWLAELEGGGGPDALPLVVRAVARQARHVAATVPGEGEGEGEAGTGRPGAAGLARARLRTASGRWAVVRGSLLATGAGDRVAVLVEPVRPPELAPLIAEALGLTDAERRVTGLVARGLSTAAVARALGLSTYTVQDHLKAVFGKSGTRTRGELVARLYISSGQANPAMG